MKYLLMLLLATGIFISSCNKEEGTGGNATITGTIYQRSYDAGFTTLQNETPAAKEDVFIIYGNDNSIGDKIETNYDGTFSFNYLQKGNYTIFFYSDDSTNATNTKISIVKTVNIGSDGKTVNIGKLLKYKSLKIDDGKATISGKVVLTNYKGSGFLEIKDISPAQEQEVYLLYSGIQMEPIRVRTNYEGVFIFANLIKGNYTVYAYSEDKTGATQKIAITRNVAITNETQSVIVNEIHIDKE